MLPAKNVTQSCCQCRPIVYWSGWHRFIGICSASLYQAASWTGLKNPNYCGRLEHLNVPTLKLRRLRADLLWCYKVVFGLAHVNVNEFFELGPCHNTRGHSNFLSSKLKLLLVCIQSFSVNVLSTSGTPCLIMSVLTLFIALDIVSCVLICLFYECY